MLASLKIENVAIIESASVEFGYGLNVMTGETGAGKSIVIDSINAVLGERTSRELIRTGADNARVYAVFEEINNTVKEILRENGIDSDEEVLVINRVINRDGRNICRVNGYPVTVGMLKKIGRELIDIHGQHDNQALLSPECHCGFVDSFAENDDKLLAYRNSFAELCRIRSEIKGISTDESEKMQRIDLLSYQIDELQKADITVGEREELTERKNLYNNSQRITESLSCAYEALRGENGSIDSLNNASAELQRASSYYENISEISEKISDMRYELEDAAETIRDNIAELDFDPSEIDGIEERLDLLYRLSRKYGETEEDMLDYLDKAERELQNISFSEERLENLRQEEKASLEKTRRAAEILTLSRREAGERLSREITSELAFLDMPDVVFRVNIEETELTENGKDNIEFLISANAGEEPKPLAKIASGGELSRIMLAVKNILADADDKGTMIFDEIDTGVSGRAAQKIGMKLKDVSKGRQVICVTHLARIAAEGDVHFYISKSVKDGKTYTKIEALDGEERVRELARITGGIEITELQLEGAREMLRSAGNY